MRSLAVAHSLLVGAIMSPVRHAFFAVASLSLLSLVVACGGAIDKPRSESIDPTAPGSSGSSGGGNGGGSRPIGTCTAAPTCDLGDTRVSSESACLQDEAHCYDRTLCEQTIWCAGTAVCAGAPSCPLGYVEAPGGCTTKDCVQSTVCGSTIMCQRDLSQCDGYPSCNPGDTQVPSPSQCLQDDATCYQRYVCGTTIWCTGPLPQDAGGPDLPPPPPKPALP